MLTTLKYKKGTSLIEVMVAVFIFAIVVLACPFMFAFGRGEIKRQESHRIAVELAAQKLEELRACNYNDIEEGDSNTALSLNDLSYSRTTEIVTENGGLYKWANVTVRWGPTGTEHSVILTTIFAPE